MASVPVDDDQPRCALSGEKFEKFWHDDFQVPHKAVLCIVNSICKFLIPLEFLTFIVNLMIVIN